MVEPVIRRVEGAAPSEAAGRFDENADLLGEAFELAPPMMGIVELTDDCDILHIRDNLATCRFFEVPPGATRQRLASSLGAGTEAIRQWTLQYHASAASGEVQRFEFVHVVGDEVCSWDVAVRALAARPNGRQRFLYVAEDASERRAAERARVQVEKRLAQVMLELREHEANEARALAAERRVRELLDEAAVASRGRAEFIGTLAHELRNPLAPILNAVQVLRSKSPIDPKLAWGSDVIHRQVRHMEWLLGDLLDVSRMARGKLELRKERVDIATVIELAMETTRSRLDAGGHQLQVELPKAQVRVDADPVRLAQIVSELLDNAAKNTPGGGHIALRVEVAPPDVILRVRDDGIGIAPKALPTIFDLFVQAASGIRRADGDLGFGLPLARGLAQLHGGTATAYSDGLGMGSEIVVAIPLPDGDETDGHTEKASPVRPAKHRVLVVDDNRDGADTLAALLDIAGCEVRVAYCGNRALEVAQAFHPAVMFLDTDMLEMSAFELTRRLRESSWGRDIFLVAMAESGQTGDRRRTYEAGFDEHLVAPVDTFVLAKLLSTVPRKA